MVKVITAKPTGLKEYLIELSKFRHLIWVFAYQDILTQFVQTKFSLLWVVFRPIISVVVFTFIFNHLFSVPKLENPYPLFVMIGLSFWNLFSFLVNNCSNVLVANQQLIKKMYFPKVILIFSKMAVGFIEFLVAIVITLLLLFFYRKTISWSFLYLPICLITTLLFGGGIALWINALTIKRRDAFHFLPNIVGFIIWLSPVFYPVKMIPSSVQKLAYFNPLAGIIEGARWSILQSSFYGELFLISFLISFLFFVTGFVFFIHQEDNMIDYI